MVSAPFVSRGSAEGQGPRYAVLKLAGTALLTTNDELLAIAVAESRILTAVDRATGLTWDEREKAWT
ncbi:MAG TPA: hypothetical protein PKA27_06940 [Fimbriimonadaceae bacterium]|nr:hypothetical protein [Fimbriimonadaceae bacterium]